MKWRQAEELYKNEIVDSSTITQQEYATWGNSILGAKVTRDKNGEYIVQRGRLSSPLGLESCRSNLELNRFVFKLRNSKDEYMQGRLTPDELYKYMRYCYFNEEDEDISRDNEQIWENIISEYYKETIDSSTVTKKEFVAWGRSLWGRKVIRKADGGVFIHNIKTGQIIDLESSRTDPELLGFAFRLRKTIDNYLQEKLSPNMFVKYKIHQEFIQACRIRIEEVNKEYYAELDRFPIQQEEFEEWIKNHYLGFHYRSEHYLKLGLDSFRDNNDLQNFVSDSRMPKRVYFKTQLTPREYEQYIDDLFRQITRTT